jgi:putative hydrolase of the HAD superfamily
MATPTIKVVFFDAADTLFHVKGSVGEVYVSRARKYGVTASQETIQEAFSRAFADAPPLAFSVNDPQEMKSCERLWWFDVVHNVFYRVGMFKGFDDYFEEVFAYFANPEAWLLYPDTVATLAGLEERGLELGLVSNFDSRLYEILIGLGIDRFFESVTLSSVVGAAKPSPQIFHRALAKHAVTAKEALHVGDSVREDVRGAEAAGIRAVILDRLGTQTDETNVVKIAQLNELFALLDDA